MNMSVRVAILTFILVMGVAVCSAGILSPETVNFTGTVNYIDLEGGFWGIVADDGKKYDPLNLPREFKKEGLRVHVEGVVKNVIGIHMWGTTIEITVINKEDTHVEKEPAPAK